VVIIQKIKFAIGGLLMDQPGNDEEERYDHSYQEIEDHQNPNREETVGEKGGEQ
jgi:hypothetical protein